MKNLIAIILVCSVWALPAKVQAQVNEEKMDKDLRVASKVLETLTHGEDGQRILYGGNNVEGNYIEGYGIIFSLNGQSIYRYRAPKVAYSYGRSSGVVVATAPVAEVKSKAEAKAKAKEQQKGEEEAIDYESIMVEFLTDYSQMIGQLKPTDKIVISTKKSDYIFVMTDKYEQISQGSISGLSAEMLKKDHNDYMSGKISQDQLVAKIIITKNDGENSRSKDLDMFGSMLGTVYDDSYTDSYFISWRPEYERIKGVGAIYAFKVFSSYSEDGL